MSNPLTALWTMQLDVINHYLAMTTNAMDFYLSLRPLPVRAVRAGQIPVSKSLVPLSYPLPRSVF